MRMGSEAGRTTRGGLLQGRQSVLATLRSQIRVLIHRGWRIAGGVSVQVKIMGIVLGMVLFLGLGVTYQVRQAMTRTLIRQLEERGISLTRDLAARSTDLVLTNNLFALHELLRDTVENNSDVRYAFLLDSQGEVLVHSFAGSFPADLTLVNPVAPEERYRLEILDTEEGLIRDFAVPVFGGQAGVARVGLTDHQVRRMVTKVTRRLLAATGLVSLVGVLTAYLLTRVLTRPILELVAATQAVARGDFSQRVVPWANDEIGQLSDAFNTMTADLAHKEALRRELLEKLIRAQEEERRRIAWELHDETGQALTCLKFGLRSLEQSSSPAEAGAHLQALRDLMSQIQQSLHDLAVELHPPALDELGLVAALQRYVTQYARHTGLTVDFQTIGVSEERLSPQVEITAYRLIQEALTNIARHAHAEHVSVMLERQKGQLMVIVDDDGQGFDAQLLLERGTTQGQLGIHSMQERVALLGGVFTVESQSGQGTTVFARLPLDGQEVEP
ncbi:MAG TPA: HAMP domain-containing protein [Anaerolineae bacterium]|nr:HAMP domain-containing protein [Anaerolineae bacterium]